MDRVKQYKTYVADLINKCASYKPVNLDIDRQSIVDHENGHYQVMSVGWRDSERIHHCVIHIDIIADKMGLQEDATDLGIAEELVELGVPKSDIVLAFYPPHKRAYTGFGVN